MSQDLPVAKYSMFTGILLIIFGIVAIATPVLASAAVVIVIGAVMLVAGVFQCVEGFRNESGASKALAVVLGVLTAVCGVGLMFNPVLGMEIITLLLAVFFVVEGIWKIIASFKFRPASGWVMILMSGVLGLLLGLIIWRQWPVSGLWAVGILVGVDLLMTGISMIAVSSTISKLDDALSQSETESSPA
ncbi:MAG: HdeD family acid-resistance protein [Pirellulales bacterium]|nr:HdeD family acid-resistance protein [Pirellulales bacterium]